jgi:hypothetical protein
METGCSAYLLDGYVVKDLFGHKSA